MDRIKEHIFLLTLPKTNFSEKAELQVALRNTISSSKIKKKKKLIGQKNCECGDKEPRWQCETGN